jgi:hypothetical protein
MSRFFSIFLSVVVLLVAVSHSYGDYPSAPLIKALALWESQGDNDQAIGDKKLANKAYGNLQIRQPCVDDVNRKFGTNYRAEDCLGNKELSAWICREYINMYATEKRLKHTPTDQDKARIWNGGPNGYKKPSTVSYWANVQKLLKS